VALRIAASLAYPWLDMGEPDARRWVARALESGSVVPPLLRGRALFGAGRLAVQALDYAEAGRQLLESVEIARQVGARRLEAWALQAYATLVWASPGIDRRPPRAWLEDALRIFREIDDPNGIGSVINFFAGEAMRALELEEATRHAREALEIGTRSGRVGVVAAARGFLAEIAAQRGEFAEAERMMEDVVALHAHSGAEPSRAFALGMRAWFVLRGGEVARDCRS
jgi:ATP/maltotriose-dependent transcriptional regulator MalT